MTGEAGSKTSCHSEPKARNLGIEAREVLEPRIVSAIVERYTYAKNGLYTD
jgi:hypothetical protein